MQWQSTRFFNIVRLLESYERSEIVSISIEIIVFLLKNRDKQEKILYTKITNKQKKNIPSGLETEDLCNRNYKRI
jgi:hypothetical protein